MDNTHNTNNSKKLDPESSSNEKNLKYPKSVFFIVGNEFCERFCYYGLKTVLVFYFTRVLNQSQDHATESYHEFILFCYFTPLIGAILADSYLGKFKTILYLSILYAVGNLALAASSYFEHGILSVFSLILIALGTGGIKPCVSAFGGDQFVAGQEDQLNKFFAIFYMSINLGSLVSTFITPILRDDVSCSSRGDCFPLAFGVPAILMTIALLLFVAGKPSYRIDGAAKGNIIFKFVHCNVYAIGVKLESLFTSKKGLEKRDHWIDYAEDKFSPKLIQDVKTVNRVLFLYLPLPLFWALFDQQGSRWTLQALKMDGILFGETALKPDQLQVINPVLIVAMIPVFSYIIYPITNKLGLVRKPLQRMTVGGLLAGAAFVLAALLQVGLESEVPKAPAPGHGAVTFINSLPCAITLMDKGSDLKISLEAGSAVRGPKDFTVGVYKFDVEPKICYFDNDTATSIDNSKNPINIKIEDGDIKAFQLVPNLDTETSKNSYSLNIKTYPHSLVKPGQGDSSIQVAYSLPRDNNELNSSHSISFSKSPKGSDKDNYETLPYSEGLTQYIKVETFSGIENYYPVIKGLPESNYMIKARNGASYILVVYKNPKSGQVNYKLNKLVEENRLHMLWQIPQYFVITCGEVMFSITGLEFSYSQANPCNNLASVLIGNVNSNNLDYLSEEAPTSMKSVVQAAWLLTVSFGNLFVAIITKYIKFNKQSLEFFFFAGLMVCDMIIFAFIAYLYTYSDQALEDGNASNATGNGTVKSNGQGVTGGASSAHHPPSSSTESPNNTKTELTLNRMRTPSGTNELQDTKL